MNGSGVNDGFGRSAAFGGTYLYVGDYKVAALTGRAHVYEADAADDYQVGSILSDPQGYGGCKVGQNWQNRFRRGGPI